MSQWTHVNAIVRLDCLVGAQGGRAVNMTPGMTPQAALAAAGPVPEGSEGPLTVQVWTNPEPGMAHGTVSVFGDLRDYDNDTEIRRWFQRLTEGMLVRSGLVEIEIENRSRIFMVYDAENRVWETVDVPPDNC